MLRKWSVCPSVRPARATRTGWAATGLAPGRGPEPVRCVTKAHSETPWCPLGRRTFTFASWSRPSHTRTPVINPHTQTHTTTPLTNPRGPQCTHPSISFAVRRARRSHPSRQRPSPHRHRAKGRPGRDLHLLLLLPLFLSPAHKPQRCGGRGDVRRRRGACWPSGRWRRSSSCPRGSSCRRSSGGSGASRLLLGKTDAKDTERVNVVIEEAGGPGKATRGCMGEAGWPTDRPAGWEPWRWLG